MISLIQSSNLLILSEKLNRQGKIIYETGFEIQNEMDYTYDYSSINNFWQFRVAVKVRTTHPSQISVNPIVTILEPFQTSLFIQVLLTSLDGFQKIPRIQLLALDATEYKDTYDFNQQDDLQKIFKIHKGQLQNDIKLDIEIDPSTIRKLDQKELPSLPQFQHGDSSPIILSERNINFAKSVDEKKFIDTLLGQNQPQIQNSAVFEDEKLHLKSEVNGDKQFRSSFLESSFQKVDLNQSLQQSQVSKSSQIPKSIQPENGIQRQDRLQSQFTFEQVNTADQVKRKIQQLQEIKQQFLTENDGLSKRLAAHKLFEKQHGQPSSKQNDINFNILHVILASILSFFIGFFLGR